MSNTIRRRKQTEFVFANSHTNRFRKVDPQSRDTWEHQKRLHGDGCGNFWLREVPKHERKSSHKKNRKQAKLAMTAACSNRNYLEDVDNYHFSKKSKF